MQNVGDNADDLTVHGADGEVDQVCVPELVGIL
jgi:hypothetical protein